MSDLLTQTQNTFRTLIESAINSAVADGALAGTPNLEFAVETPADKSHGDLATNAAMVNARAFHRAPRDIAAEIIKRMPLEGTMLRDAQAAGAGFINVFFTNEYLGANVAEILRQGSRYGCSDHGKGKKINVEFVSANPTGPMHLGNARGGALGDCMAAVMSAAGYDVTKEFYVNDAGNQIERFGASLEARYMQHFKGDSVVMPEDGYQGEDVIAHAEAYIAENGDSLLNVESEQRRKALVEYALPLNIAKMKSDLARYRIEYDKWFYESTLHESGAVTAVIKKLTENGHTYEKDGAVWYRPPVESASSDESGENDKKAEPPKDEVLVRNNGIPTYFAADIAYHYNKLAVRNFDTAINIWGADHHGHVARLKGAVEALGLDGERVDVVLMQLVRLVRDGQPVRMSKRTGKAISLTDLLDDVPVDAARFFFNLREPQSHLEFDLDLAVSTSSENPVYYVQYAHARICSILRALDEQGTVLNAMAPLDVLCSAEEKELICKLAQLPSLVAVSADSRDPAIITRYCIDLATLFHKFYNSCRVKDAPEQLLTPRVKLCMAVKQTLCNCLSLLKISAPEKM